MYLFKNNAVTIDRSFYQAIHFCFIRVFTMCVCLLICFYASPSFGDPHEEDRESGYSKKQYGLGPYGYGISDDGDEAAAAISAGFYSNLINYFSCFNFPFLNSCLTAGGTLTAAVSSGYSYFHGDTVAGNARNLAAYNGARMLRSQLNLGDWIKNPYMAGGSYTVIRLASTLSDDFSRATYNTKQTAGIVGIRLIGTLAKTAVDAGVFITVATHASSQHIRSSPLKCIGVLVAITLADCGFHSTISALEQATIDYKFDPDPDLNTTFGELFVDSLIPSSIFEGVKAPSKSLGTFLEAYYDDGLPWYAGKFLKLYHRPMALAAEWKYLNENNSTRGMLAN